MPRLKDISCTVDYAGTDIAFKEYGTQYGDGFVETFISVPDHPQDFLIHLKSHGFIASGLAMLVFIDGNYQCNRNRFNLRPPKAGDADSHHTEVEFRVRQKEQKNEDKNLLYGRQWQFDRCNFIPIDAVPADARFTDFEHLGEIEVIVVRCQPPINLHEDSDSDSFTDREAGDLNQLEQRMAALSTMAPPYAQTTYRSPTVVEESTPTEERIGAFSGLFDGAADDSRQSGLDGVSERSNHHFQNSGQQSGWGATGVAPDERIYGPSQGGRQSQQMPFTMPPFPQHPMVTPYGWPMTMPNMPMTYSNPWMMGYTMAPPYMPPNNVPDPANFPGAPMIHPSTVSSGQIYPGHSYHSGPHQHVQGLPQTAQEHTVPPRNPHPAFNGVAPAVYVNVGQPGGWDHSAGPTQHFAAPVNTAQIPVTAQSPGAGPAWGSQAGGTPPDNQDNNGGDQNNAENGDWNQNDPNNNAQAAGDNDWEKNAGGDSRGNDSGDQNDNWAAGSQAGSQRQNTSGSNWGNNDGNGGWKDKTQGNSWDQGGVANNNASGDSAWDNAGNNNANQNQPVGGLQQNTPQQHRDPSQDHNGFSPNVQSGYRALRGPFGIYHHAPNTTRTTIEAEPLYDVPDYCFAYRGLTHQVRPGAAYLYTHKKAAPVYIDSCEEPYARFIFKYRCPDVIQQLTGQQIIAPTTPAAVAEQTLTSLSRDQLISMIQNFQQNPSIPLQVRAQVTSPAAIWQPPPPAPKTDFLGSKTRGTAGLGIHTMGYGAAAPAHEPNTGTGGGHVYPNLHAQNNQQQSQQQTTAGAHQGQAANTEYQHNNGGGYTYGQQSYAQPPAQTTPVPSIPASMQDEAQPQNQNQNRFQPGHGTSFLVPADDGQVHTYNPGGGGGGNNNSSRQQATSQRAGSVASFRNAGGSNRGDGGGGGGGGGGGWAADTSNNAAGNEAAGGGGGGDVSW